MIQEVRARTAKLQHSTRNARRGRETPVYAVIHTYRPKLEELQESNNLGQGEVAPLSPSSTSACYTEQK